MVSEDHPYCVGINSALTVLGSDSFIAETLKRVGRRKAFKRDFKLIQAYRDVITQQIVALKKNALTIT